jgi:hypothetical protein
MSERQLMVGPTSLVVRVVQPSGKIVPDASVKIVWNSLRDDEEDQPRREDDFPVEQETTTDAHGYAVLGVPSGVWSKGILTVFRRHHGPVVPVGAPFKGGPAEVPIEVGMNLFVVPGQPRTLEVRWGAPRVAHFNYRGKKIVGVEVTLVEGGSLGVEHAEIRTRRLSVKPKEPPADAEPGTHAGLSEVDAELLYHIAHGNVALTEQTDFEFEHDETLDDCVPGRCGIVPRAPHPSSADPAFTSEEEEFPYVPKIAVRNGVAGGLRVLGLASVGDLYKPGPASFRFTNGYIVHQNPRNVVGLLRLCVQLSRQHEVRSLLSVGFIRYYSLKDLQISTEPVSEAPVDWKKLKRDAHGRGRAVDVAGVMLDHPMELASQDSFYPRPGGSPELAWRDPTATLRSFETKEYAAERDFLVYPHWGKVPMLVKDEHGVRRRVDGEQSPWVSMQFSDAFRPKLPSKGRIFYRLENLGDPVHPDTPDQRIQLLPAHVMTPRHYELARDLFRFVYEFFAQEYSHRDRLLGNLDELQSKRIRPDPDERQRAEVDDTGAAPTLIGEVGGFVLHPDVPSAGTRRHHQNHIHANLGHDGPPKRQGEIWTETELAEARKYGYER